MNDPARYQQADDTGTKRRRLPRPVWVAVLVVVVLGLVVVLLAGGGGHDPSQLNH